MNSGVQFRFSPLVDLDKEEEYLHEMHLKGWRYRTNRFGFSILNSANQMMWIYSIYGILDSLERMR